MQQIKPAILVLCTANSCRSQMAEGIFRQLLGDQFEVHSAGTIPAKSVNPRAVQVMSEIGIDIGEQKPKDLGLYLGRLSVRHLFIVCEQAENKCPKMFPGMLSRNVWPIRDPESRDAACADPLEDYRTARDELEARVKEWIETL